MKLTKFKNLEAAARLAFFASCNGKLAGCSVETTLGKLSSAQKKALGKMDKSRTVYSVLVPVYVVKLKV